MLGLIATAFVLALAFWVGADLLRSLGSRPIPSRPATPMNTEENRLLAVLAMRAVRAGRDVPGAGPDHLTSCIPPELADDDMNLDSAINTICSWVDARYDCSDFRLVSLIRILYDYTDQLTTGQLARVKRTVLGFKYWLDEPGEDSMCYWTENHQILFATAEYLVGQLYPDERFTNSGMTGTEHIARGRQRILTWIEQRWRYGFTEWYSNVYYTEDIGALSNLIDLARDAEIIEKARIAMDLLLLDVASQSINGSFVSNSGRLYEASKKAGSDSTMHAIAVLLAGAPNGEQINATSAGMGIGFFLCRGYSIPRVLKHIARDPSPIEVRTSNGLGLDELRNQGRVGLDQSQVMIQWGMGAFTNPEVVSNTIDLVNRHQLHRHQMLHPLGVLNIGLLRRIGLLPIVTRVLNPQSNGIAIQRSNSYLYRTSCYSLSTSQSYHPGTYGDQQHIWQATLADDLSVFTTHPAARRGDRGVFGNSPNYWVGSGRLPHSVQERNVNMTLYRLPARSGPFEVAVFPCTHAWFPEECFDEVLVRDRYAFGRRGPALIAVIAGLPLWYGPEGEYDPADPALPPPHDPREELVQFGRDTWWVTEMSTLQAETSFAGFQERILGNAAVFDCDAAGGAGRLSYESAGRRFELIYRRSFSVNGTPIDTAYDRLESPYGRVPRDPPSMTIRAGGDELHLVLEPPCRTLRSSSDTNPASDLNAANDS